MSQSPREPESLAEGTLISHLLELRTRLLHAVVAVAVCFMPLVFFSNQLFTLIARPLIDKLPEGTSIIATSVVAPFMTPLKLSLIAAVFVAMPYILYQVWAFVAPGLYRHEKRFALPLFVSSVVLFGAKRLRNVGSDLGAAVRGFKKSMNEGDDETTKQLDDMSGKDADFKERADSNKSDSKPSA
jgi:TatA/E family protein of Tat protein translocase